MSRSSYLFAGIFGTFAVSCFALILAPHSQIGNLQPQFDLETNDVYPVKNDQGRDVYVSEGCMYCHSQQVRDPQNSLDLERGWGVRRTVARDYILESVPLLGNSRLGPDLTNVGSKTWRNEPKDDTRKPVRRDAAWQYLHLYFPQAIVAESNMPSYRYLFTQRKITGQKSDNALDLTVLNRLLKKRGEDEIPAGYEIVPKPEAVQLVKYLSSLDRTHPLNEVKVAGAAAAAK